MAFRAASLVFICTAGMLPIPQRSIPVVQPTRLAERVAEVSRHGQAHLLEQPPARASRGVHRLPLVWRKVAWCESRWHERSVSKSKRYHGLFQIESGWWRGAHLNPATATIEQQYALALHIYKKQGRRAWPYCGRKAGLR